MKLRPCALLCAAMLMTPFAQAVDTDGDGVDDDQDNCSQLANPDQRDSNGDGFGNACDLDLNNDLIVNFVDLGILRSVFFTADEDADSNGDGTVNFVDLGSMRSQFFRAPGPGATTPSGFGQRPVAATFDYDLNGLTDATSQLDYDDDGNLTQQVYTVVDDGTPDTFNPISEFGFTADYTYTDGLLTRIEQDNNTDGNDFVSDFTYNADGTIATTTTTVFDSVGTPLNTFVIEYFYGNGLRERDEWTLPGFGLVLTVFHSYDADGLIETSDWQNAGAPGGQFYRYTWDENDKLEEIALDVERDGIFDEITSITHAGGRPISRAVIGSLSVTPPNFTEMPFYGADGRIDRIDYDANSDGTIDAVGTAVWEDGPCRKFFLPNLNPTNLAGSDGDPDSASGDVLFCGP